MLTMKYLLRIFQYLCAKSYSTIHAYTGLYKINDTITMDSPPYPIQQRDFKFTDVIIHPGKSISKFIIKVDFRLKIL